ncbi:hypothetical protein [Niabella beijingensis]|uniref:hypothetical protein n=1 Tax=Niabella beijingensis TaxID=2872700 RepID=UPI001CBC7A50|nr:hypothetical protein [Niabella beijingensis]MBZ4192435.1 hypothetical protein [Niabella beijingensis]
MFRNSAFIRLYLKVLQVLIPHIVYNPRHGPLKLQNIAALKANKSQIWHWLLNAEKGIAEVLQTAPQKAPYAGN